MRLPPLPPDVAFTELPGTAEAIDFAFSMKRAAMGPHIVSRWGWDESFQRDLHHRRFAEKPFYAISSNSERIGVLSWLAAADVARFGEFYLLPTYQGKGIGSRILTHVLEEADRLGIPVKLEHLIWNPVGSLYRRHGFLETSRSEIHVFMTRAAAAAQR